MLTPTLDLGRKRNVRSKRYRKIGFLRRSARKACALHLEILKQQFMNAIGINDEQCARLVDKLNQLLANYMMFYQNTRGLHWNIRGEKFFELHLKFEELYTNLLLKVDEVAERVLTLGGTPLHTFDDYRSASSIKPVKNMSTASGAVSSILEAFNAILPGQRELLKLSADAGDEGTNALMSDYIREQEKLVWMYSAYLSK